MVLLSSGLSIFFGPLGLLVPMYPCIRHCAKTEVNTPLYHFKRGLKKLKKLFCFIINDVFAILDKILCHLIFVTNYKILYFFSLSLH